MDEYPVMVSYPAGLQQDYIVHLSLDRFGIGNFYLAVRFRLLSYMVKNAVSGIPLNKSVRSWIH